MSYDPALFVDRQQEMGYLERLLRHERSKAVMCIRAGEWMGKSWLVSRMGCHCRDASQVACCEVDFRSRREVHEVQDTLSLVRLLRTKLNRPDYFSHLNQVINSFTSPGAGGAVSALDALARRIEAVYDLRELAQLSQFLDVRWENVPGDTIYQKASGLAGHMQRQGRLSDLLVRLRAERGHVDWLEGLEALSAEEPAGAGVEDLLAPLADEGARGRDLVDRRINEAFFECLAALARGMSVAFFFDGCEQAPGEAMAWIRHELLDRMRTGELENTVVILAGRTHPDLSDVDVRSLVVDVELDGFDEGRVGEFLAAHRLEVGADEMAFLARASGGVPGMLARMVDNLRARQDSKDPFLDG